MKFFLPLVSALLVTTAVPVWAQTPPNPDNTAEQAEKARTSTAVPAASPSPTAPIEPPSLIPSNILPGAGELPQIPAAPDLEQLNNFFKHTSLGKAADEHRLHVQMTELETRIRNDQDLHAAKTAALQARTDLKRRHLLHRYYELYYGKLHTLADDPGLRAYVDSQKAAHELILLQPNVRHETDEAQAQALAKAKAGATVAPVPVPAQAKPQQGPHP
jgi:hypothetical protein